MIFFRILEPLLFLLVFAVVVSQCLIPELLGQPWLPIFRRGWKVRREIGAAEEEISTVALEQKLNALKHKGESHAVQPDPGPDGSDSSKRP